jgi:hypothetical protein
VAERPASTGIAVVHGVGDPKPGETLDALVESLCGRNPSLRIEASSRRVLPGSRYESEIVVPQRRLVDRSGKTLLMSEVFWGDVGRVSESWSGSASAVSSLAMGLHALIFAGGGVPGCGVQPHLPHFTNEDRWLRAAFWTAFVGAYHIKGALMPLAVAQLTLGVFSMLVSSGAEPPPWPLLFVLPVAGMLALFLPAFDARKRPPPCTGDQKAPPERWVVPTLAAGIWCVVGYVVPVCGILIATTKLDAADGWLVGLVFSGIFGLCHMLVICLTLREHWWGGGLRVVKQIAFCAASTPWTVLTVLLCQRDDASQVMSDLGSLLMSTYHLALGLAALWVFVIGGCCARSVFADKEQRDRGKAIFLGYAFEFSLWATIATTLAWLAWKLPDHERLTWLGVQAAYSSGTWFQVAPVAFLFSLGLGVKIFMWLWKRKNEKAKPGIADLVGSWPLPVVTIITAAVCLVASAAVLNLPLVRNPSPWFATMCAILLTGLVFVVRTFREPLHHGLDLATDVTLYFRGRSWASSDQHRTDQLLKARFRAVVENLAKDVADGTLVVVAHSQGTVIAADALRDWSNAPRVDLLTMGSPLRSLYATFFRKGFGDIVEGAGSKAERWVNLYREDDYVGRQLGGVTDNVTDKKIDGTGHEGYWTDPSVLAELEGLIKL